MAVGVTLPAVIHAEVHVDGFLNVVGGYATERDNGPYDQEQWVFEPDSSFGLQISRELSQKTSVTGQLISRGSSSFEVEASWAYMTYQVSESSRFRAGRFRTPFFLYSDYLDVGYAQHWLTPPDEVYALQFDSVNGIDFNYRLPISWFTVNVQVYAGSANSRFAMTHTDDELQVEVREQLGIVGTLGYQWLTLRTSFHQVSNLTINNFAEITLPSPLTTVGGLQQALIALDQQVDLGAGGDYILSNLDVAGVAAEFSEAAIKMEWANVFVVAEGTLLTFDQGPLAKQRRHFASIGARAADFTVYASYARANDEQVDLSGSLTTIPGVTDGLKQVLNGLTSSLMVQSESSSIGLRYDFEPGAAFKFELSESQVPASEDSYLARLGYNLIF